MKRRLTLFVSLSLIGALCAVTFARAGLIGNQYAGYVEHDTSTYFGFDVKRIHGKKRITKITATIPYVCTDSGTGGYGYGKGRGSLPVKHGKFSGKLPITNFAARGSIQGGYYRVKGSAPKRGTARGSIDAAVIVSATRRGASQRVCYSGGLDWKVDRIVP